MQIAADKVVSFHYRMSEPGKAVIEDSREGEPVAYLHGHHNLLAGLEEVMQGHKAGDTFTATLAPEQAYGVRRDNAVQRISVKHVYNPGNRKVTYKPGMVVQVNSEEGPREVTVVKAGFKTLDVDTNHPLAGLTLNFEVEVLDVRDATAEEIEHGHAHGADGHHH